MKREVTSHEDKTLILWVFTRIEHKTLRPEMIAFLQLFATFHLNRKKLKI